MLCFPCAKINLGLYILNKRSDGYHNLFSIFYPIPYCDALEIRKANAFKLQLYGNPIKGNPENNIVVKAYKLLHSMYKIPPVEVDLIKNIPTEAGLGGGSSDAAIMLNKLNQLFNLKIQIDELRYLSKRIGSDCPFFIQKEENLKPALVEGIGDKIKILSPFLKEKFIVIINPQVKRSTKSAFKMIEINHKEKELKKNIEHFKNMIIQNENIHNWRNSITNVFEKQLFSVYPKLSKIKNGLYKKGAFYASMTGSGSSVYGLFDSFPSFSQIEDINIKVFSL